MKKTGVDAAQLTPDLGGWRLHRAGAPPQVAATLEEAAALAPAGAPLHLALPGHMALLERLTLPSIDRAELAGMVELQLEKTLPYPVEEVTSDFQVLRQTETESTLASIAVHLPPLEALCKPLRDRGRLPQKITLWALHLAARSPADEAVLALWGEAGQLAVAIFENGKLSWTQTLPATDADTLTSELPPALLSAELEGVPTDFRRILLAPDLQPLADPLRTAFEGLPIEPLPTDERLPEPAENFVPASWMAETQRTVRVERIKQRLLLAAVIYLLLLAAGFVYLAWTKRRVQTLDVQLAQIQPQVAAINQSRARYDALAAAIDPSRSAVEILFQVYKNRPSPDVKVTTFNYSVDLPGKAGVQEFSLRGEAPSGPLAVEYTERLRAVPELGVFKIDATLPKVIQGDPGNRVEFQISGRL